MSSWLLYFTPYHILQSQHATSTAKCDYAQHACCTGQLSVSKLAAQAVNDNLLTRAGLCQWDILGFWQLLTQRGALACQGLCGRLRQCQPSVYPILARQWSFRLLASVLASLPLAHPAKNPLLTSANEIAHVEFGRPPPWVNFGWFQHHAVHVTCNV